MGLFFLMLDSWTENLFIFFFFPQNLVALASHRSQIFGVCQNDFFYSSLFSPWSSISSWIYHWKHPPSSQYLQLLGTMRGSGSRGIATISWGGQDVVALVVMLEAQWEHKAVLCISTQQLVKEDERSTGGGVSGGETPLAGKGATPSSAIGSFAYMQLHQCCCPAPSSSPEMASTGCTPHLGALPPFGGGLGWILWFLFCTGAHKSSLIRKNCQGCHHN
jgi:hypothetical protein